MDKSRQQFEEWFNENGISTGWCSKRDLEFIKTKMFSCWQASRESLINNLESVGYIGDVEIIDLKYSRVSYLYKDNIDKINIPLYRIDK